jgi:hypothetical protein
MEILSKILEIVNNKISLPVALLCGLLLFGPDWILDKLGVLTFVSSTKAVISLTFLFSVDLYSYEKGKKLHQYLKTKWEIRAKARTHQKAIVAHLQGLTPDEEVWIYFCLRENVRTLYATAIKATAIALENKRLVYRPNTVYDTLLTPFTFYPEVWKYLTLNREEYCPAERLEDPQYNETVDRLISNLRSVV